jgi:hypothetical protein
MNIVHSTMLNLYLYYDSTASASYISATGAGLTIFSCSCHKSMCCYVAIRNLFHFDISKSFSLSMVHNKRIYCEPKKREGNTSHKNQTMLSINIISNFINSLLLKYSHSLQTRDFKVSVYANKSK